VRLLGVGVHNLGSPEDAAPGSGIPRLF
jgi:hypothetical protein